MTTTKSPTYGQVHFMSQTLAGNPPQLVPASKPGDVCQTCPKPMMLLETSGEGGSAPAKPTPIEYCDIKQLSIQLSQQGKSQTIVINWDRKTEGVSPSTDRQYAGYLSSHDLVIEALTDIKNVDHFGTQGASPASSRPLVVTLTATNEFSHASFGPAHPLTTAAVQGGAPIVTDGGAPAKATYQTAYDKSSAVGGAGLAAWNPFSAGRIMRQDLIAAACGNRPIPQRPQRRRSAKLVVFPYEEIGIEIGLRDAARQGSYSTGRVIGQMDDKNGKLTSREITRTTISKSRVGNTVSETKIEKMKTQAGHGRTRETNSDTTLETRFLGTDSTTVKSVEESWKKGNPVTSTDAPKFQARKVKLTHKIGGVESTADVGKLAQEAGNVLKKLEKGKEIFDSLQSIFNKTRIGWSFSASYEMLSGSFSLTYGNRWPSSYKETNRVYYIERYVRAGGQIELISGKLGAFFGFAVDPWFLPVSVEVGGYLDVKASVSVSANLDFVWTSPSERTKINLELPGVGKISAELGVKANGRAAGFSVNGRFAFESQAQLDVTAGLPAEDTTIYIETSCRFGKPASGTGKPSPGLQLVGELIFTGFTVRTYQMEPQILIEGRQFWKNKPLIGTKPSSQTWQ